MSGTSFLDFNYHSFPSYLPFVLYSLSQPDVEHLHSFLSIVPLFSLLSRVA